MTLSNSLSMNRMPCNCGKKAPDYPRTYNWGPPMWSILHYLSVRVGGYAVPSYVNDEKFIWAQIFPLRPSIVPCPECREHLSTWMKARPVNEWASIEAAARKEWLTTYFYDLHEAVNQRLGKPSYDKARLLEAYGALPLRNILNQLKPFMDIAIRQSGITLLPWQRVHTHILHLLSIYGV